MSNDFYTKSGWPAQSANGDSASARSELAAIEAGFNKMPALTASGLRLVRVNAGATALESVTPTTAGLETTAGVQAGSQISLATAKTTPDDADVIPALNSAAGGILTKFTWANIKAALAALTTTWAISTTGNAATATTANRVTSGTGTGGIRSSSKGPNDGIGFSTGAGGTVTQATSKSTAVSVDGMCGQIVCNNAALAAGAIVSFQVNNASISNESGNFRQIVLASIDATGGGITLGVYAVEAEVSGPGNFVVTLKNNGSGPYSEAVIITFIIFNCVTS